MQAEYSRPPLDDLARCDHTEVFDWLASELPASGSAIDWSKVSSHHEHQQFDDEEQLRSAACAAVTVRLTGGRRAQHGGDSLSPTGVWIAGVLSAEEVIHALLAIPERHYFLSEDRTWLVVVRMEGDLDVLDLNLGVTR